VVTLNITCVNDAPVANPRTFNFPEDPNLAAPTPGVLLNDTDAEGDPLTAVLDTDVSHGSLNLSSNGSFFYGPTTNFCGTDSFTYHANDGQANSNIATVTINLACVNDAPVAVANVYTTTEDIPLSINAPGILENDIDVDGDVITAVLNDDVNDGTLNFNSDGSFTYAPDAEYCGTDNFSYHANDGALNSSVVVVMLNIACVNDVPVASADVYTTTEDIPLSINAPGVLANDDDIEEDTLTAILDSDVISGALTLNTNGSFTYTPDENFCGSDSFSYHANDGSDDSNVVSVMLNVDCVNDLPEANDDGYSVEENSADNLFDVLVNDTDPDGDAITIMSVSAAANGTAVISGATILYTPNADFEGTDTFTYTITDGILTATATVTVEVSSQGFMVYMPVVIKP
jgi:VCBS repeat-containing protein